MLKEAWARISDNISDRNKLRFFVYEFIGTALLCYGYNMRADVYLIMLWLCWDVSAAHFNCGLSLANVLMTMEEG